MPRVLLVTYEFPPMGGVGVQRVLKLAKYLPSCGWDVSVLTVDDPPASLVDESLLSELPQAVAVHRAWSLEPTRAIQWLRRVRRSSGTTGEAGTTADPPRRAGLSGMPPWVVRLVQAFFVPDEKRLWRGPARRAALRIVESEACRSVLSSGPPFTAHLVARDVARGTGLPWVADLRDPWVGNYFFRPPTPLHAWLQARWERRVVVSASAVVVVSEGMADDLRRRHPDVPADQFRVVPNGFDPEDMPAPGPSDPRFGVAYLGAFQGAIAPDVFLAGVASAIRRGLVPREGVGVRFIGAGSAAVTGAVARHGLTDVVTSTGYLSHRSALAEAARSPVLLLVLPPGPASRPILTGKLPEYLGLGRTVLALAPDGVARSLVEEAGAGVVVDPQDAEGVADALGDLYRDWAAGALPVPRADVVSRYDRRLQAAEFAAILRCVVEAEAV